MLRRELDRVDHSQDLVEIAARGHRVAQHQLDLLVGADDEDRAHGLVGRGRAALGGAGLLGRQHIVELGDLKVAVADDGIVDLRALGLLDVGKPSAVAVDRIDAEPDQLGVALGEFGLDLGHVAEFRGADRREVLGMGEQDRPAVADKVVEVDRSLGGLRHKIGRSVVDANCHGKLRSECVVIRATNITDRRPRRLVRRGTGGSPADRGAPSAGAIRKA